MTGRYEIRIRGRLWPEVLELLADLTPRTSAGSTVLHTEGTDQPSLHGTLARIQTLGLDIDRIERVRSPERAADLHGADRQHDVHPGETTHPRRRYE